MIIHPITTHFLTIKYITIPKDYCLSTDRKRIAFKSVLHFTQNTKYTIPYLELQTRAYALIANLTIIAHIALLSITIAVMITKKNCSVSIRKTLFRTAQMNTSVFKA